VTPHSATATQSPDGHTMRFVALCSVLLFTAVLYWPTTTSLITMWNTFGSRFYTHGDLIVVLAALALLRRRAALAQLCATPCPVAAAALVPLSLTWMMLYLSTFQIGHQMCFPVLLLAAVYAVFGRGYARLCSFPIGYLYFAIPVWTWTVPWLQRMTIAVMRVALPLAGVPTYIAGDVVQIPAGVFTIEGGCSGSAYLVVGLAIAAYYADMHDTSSRSSMLLLTLAAVCAIVGNWVRVFVIIVAGQLTAMQSYLVRVSHDEFGWLVFSASMVVFFIVAPRMTHIAKAVLREKIVEPTVTLAGTAGRLRPAFLSGIALTALAVGPVWSQIVLHRPTKIAPNGVLLEGGGSWAGPFPYSGPWQPLAEGADASQAGTYRGASGAVDLYIAVYRKQTETSKLQRAGGSKLDARTLVVDHGLNAQVASQPVREHELEDADGRHSVVLTAYSVGDRATASVISAQLWYAVESLRATPSSCVIEVHADCTQECSAARARALSFLAGNRWVLVCKRIAGLDGEGG
jgi:exosortase